MGQFGCEYIVAPFIGKTHIEYEVVIKILICFQIEEKTTKGSKKQKGGGGKGKGKPK